MSSGGLASSSHSPARGSPRCIAQISPRAGITIHLKSRCGHRASRHVWKTTQTPYATLGCIFDEPIADREPPMKLKAPIITLLAGLVLAAGLYISDIRLSHEVASKKAAADI